MTRKIYFIRHGQSEWNELGKINSLTETSLSDEGIIQCNKLSRIIKALNIGKIFTSPLRRAQQTAQIINKNVNKLIQIDERLRELDFGKFEGFTMDFNGNETLKNEFQRWHEGIGSTIPDTVESFEKCQMRGNEFIEELINNETENVIVVTHGVFLRIIIMACILKSNAALYKKLKVDNGSICVVEIESNGAVRLASLNLSYSIIKQTENKVISRYMS